MARNRSFTTPKSDLMASAPSRGSKSTLTPLQKSKPVTTASAAASTLMMPPVVPTLSTYGSRKRRLAAVDSGHASAILPSAHSGKDHSTDFKSQENFDEDAIGTTSQKKPRKQQQEKRLRMFRNKAPQSFLEKLHRAQTQRMIVISRTRHQHSDDSPSEDIDIVGSTGNIYRVTISHQPTCTCPDSTKGNECKHKVYTLHTVLKAPENLQYQLALLSSELNEIFEGAPPILTDTATTEGQDGKRKSTYGECPICYFDLEGEDDDLVWCKVACGNNMHKTCFEQWAASQKGQMVKCVYCRTPWEMDKKDLEKVKKMGEMTAEGYVNVAGHFGMSGARDYSSYHQLWVRRTYGMGWSETATAPSATPSQRLLMVRIDRQHW